MHRWEEIISPDHHRLGPVACSARFREPVSNTAEFRAENWDKDKKTEWFLITKQLIGRIIIVSLITFFSFFPKRVMYVWTPAMLRFSHPWPPFNFHVNQYMHRRTSDNCRSCEHPATQQPSNAFHATPSQNSCSTNFSKRTVSPWPGRKSEVGMCYWLRRAATNILPWSCCNLHLSC